MASIKRFLILFTVVYLIIATGINVILGPPGMSKEYLAEFNEDQNQYVESIKNKQFKIWKQRPHLVDFTAEENEGLQARIDFVREYESRDAFQKEQDRRTTYDMIFDLFNTLMVIVLIVTLARKPVAGLIDTMIEAIRTKIANAEEDRKRADERLEEAEIKVKGLTQDLAGYEGLVNERIENIRRDSALFTGESLAILNNETADRNRFAEVKAIQQVKEQLVEAAIEQVLADYQADDSNDADDILIERFLSDLREGSL